MHTCIFPEAVEHKLEQRSLGVVDRRLRAADYMVPESASILVARLGLDVILVNAQ